jgi:hypothetical protein
MDPRGRNNEIVMSRRILSQPQWGANLLQKSFVLRVLERAAQQKFQYTPALGACFSSDPGPNGANNIPCVIVRRVSSWKCDV